MSTSGGVLPASKAASEVICFGCNAPITQKEKVLAKEKYFHPEHFTCTICNKNLIKEKFSFDPKSQKFFCTEDFITHFCQTCAHCNEKIVGNCTMVRIECVEQSERVRE